MDELRSAVEAEGWQLNTLYFDRGESDWVTFKFTVGQTAGECFFSTINGQIFGEFWGVKATSLKQSFHSQVGTHDNCRWFQKLLTVCLMEKPAENIKAFGYDVEIEVATGPASSKVITKHWRSKSEAHARRSGLLVPCAKQVLKCTPLTEKEWITAYGDPRMKAES